MNKNKAYQYRMDTFAGILYKGNNFLNPVDQGPREQFLSILKQTQIDKGSKTVLTELPPLQGK